jgi:ATP-dependent DNA helicase RecG
MVKMVTVMAYVEDSYHELKEHLSDKLPEIIAAFANAEGGEIIIGVKDNGTVAGIPDGQLDVTQRKLENYIKSVEPPPPHRIERRTEEGKNIIVATISKMQDGFCTYKGVFYYRHGSVTDRLGGAQLKDFLASRNMIYFDSQACPSATTVDIDGGKLGAFIEKRSDSGSRNGALEANLANLGLLHRQKGRLEITNAAILFFGRDPYRFFKQNEVRLASFAGYNASDEVLDREDLHSTIPDNVEEALKFIKRNTRASYEIKDLKRVEVPEYPERALREALVNAVAHRDYFSMDSIQIRIFSNRIEFINPGTPPDGIGIDSMDSGISIKRNPVIYQFMRDMRYMEGMATGIPLIKKEMEKAGMPQPEYNIVGSFLVLVLYNRLGKRFDFDMLNDRQKQGIETIRSKGKITSVEYARQNSISLPTAIADLSSMVREGLLKRIGKTRGTFYIINEG